MLKTEKDFLTSIIKMNVETQDVPGIAMAIWEKGKIVYNTAIGYANALTKEKLTTEHRFRIASQSKTFTSVAILKLARKGYFELDDDITKHLNFLNNSYRGITIRQILCHRAGLRNDYSKTDYWFKKNNFPNATQLKNFLKTDHPILQANSIFK